MFPFILLLMFLCDLMCGLKLLRSMSPTKVLISCSSGNKDNKSLHFSAKKISIKNQPHLVAND